VADEKRATPAQIALAWLLAQKPWIVPIPGTTKLHRLEENIAADNVELTPVDRAEIAQAAAVNPRGRERYPPHLMATTGDGFLALLYYCGHHQVGVVLVENSSRFARDPAVQLTGHELLRCRDVELVPVDAPTYFTGRAASTSRTKHHGPGHEIEFWTPEPHALTYPVEDRAAVPVPAIASDVPLAQAQHGVETAAEPQLRGSRYRSARETCARPPCAWWSTYAITAPATKAHSRRLLRRRSSGGKIVDDVLNHRAIHVGLQRGQFQKSRQSWPSLFHTSDAVRNISAHVPCEHVGALERRDIVVMLKGWRLR
jgi:hypothetical protein